MKEQAFRSSIRVEELFQRLVAHRNFAQLCLEMYERSTGKLDGRPSIRPQLRNWLKPYQEQLSKEAFEELFQKLYTAALKAVSERGTATASRKMDTSLFPELPHQDVRGSSTGTLSMYALHSASPHTTSHARPSSTASSNLAPESVDDAIFPDVSEVRDWDSLRAQAALTASENDLQLPIPQPYSSDTSEVQAAASLSVSGQWLPMNVDPQAEDDLRYQTIPFEGGFYLLDRSSGAIWMMEMGASELKPCFFEQGGNVTSAWPPQLKSKVDLASPLQGAAITVPFSDAAVAGELAPEAKELNPPSLDEMPLTSSFEVALNASLDEAQTSDELEDASSFSEEFDTTLQTDIKQSIEVESSIGADSIDDDVAYAFPPVESMSNVQDGPRQFASQVAEQVPYLHSSEDLSILPPVGAYAEELHPTLLPNRLRPGEGASYDTLHGFDPLNQDILTSYPYPIARLYEAFLSENDPRLRLRLLMLVFFHLIKYATFPLMIQYLKHPEIRDVATHQTFLRLQSTRWGNWLEFLRCGADLFEGTSIPFTEDIIKAYRSLETHRTADERFLYTQRFLDPLGVERVTHLHLGLLEALVVYRDSFVHGFTPTLDQAHDDLIVYEPILRTILQEMSFVKEYPLLYTFQRKKEGAYLCYPLMGAHPEPGHDIIEVPAQDQPSERPLFLMMPDEPSRSLSLFPLLVSGTPRLDDSPIPLQHHAIFLFHGCNGRQMLYHNLWQVPFSTDEQFPYWQELLQCSVYPKPSPQTTYPSVVHRASQWTERQFDQLRFNQQYYPELLIPRRSVQRVIHDFFSSHASALLVHGVGGVGKTSLLASHSEQLLQSNQPVVWLRGPDIRDADISHVLCSILGIEVRSHSDLAMEYLAQSLTPLLSEDTPLVVVFDDIHLPYESKSVWSALDHWLSALSDTTLADRVKVIFLVESRIYKQYVEPQPFPLSSSEFFTFEDSFLYVHSSSIALEIPPFFPDEVELAYRHYQNFQNGHGITPFRPSTAWEDIPVDASCREVLRHPFLLRLAMATFCQQELPAMLPIDDLFNQYLEQIIEEKYAPLPIPERLQFMEVLLREFYTARSSVLTRGDLLDSEESQLLRALQNAHTDSPLIQLLHLGVLVEEWRAEQCTLRFASPLLFSFFLTREWRRQSSLEDLSMMFALIEDDWVSSPLRHTFLFVWLELLRNQQAPTLCSWLHEHIQSVDKLLEEFLLMLGRLNDTHWLPFIEELLMDAPPQVFHVLLRVADQLLYSGYELVVRRLLDVLQSSMGYERSDFWEVEILFRCARLHELQNRRDKSKLLYEQIKQKHAHASSKNILAQTYLRLASLARQQGRPEEASVELIQVQEAIDFTDFPGLQARVIRQQGNIAYEQSDLDRALHHYQQSLRLDESVDNLRGIAASLSNLGTVYGSKNELENARSRYHRCLRIYQRLGDRKNVALTLNNIGIIYKKQGKQNLALEHFLRSLRLREELNLYREIVLSHTNIALLYKQQGELGYAQEHTHKNLKILERLHDVSGTAHALHLMGELYALQNEFDLASEHYDRAQSYFRKQNDVLCEAIVMLSQGRLCEYRGQLEGALTHFRKAREVFESSQSATDLIAALQAIASVYAKREQFEQATNELQHALSLAEQLHLGVDILDIMLELAHVRLLRHDVPAAQAYTDRAQALCQELDLPIGRKDVLALVMRLCIREDNWVRLNDQLQQLESVLIGIPCDTSPERTAWVLYEAARFFQDLDQARSLELCKRVSETLQGRFFPKSKDIEHLIETLQYTPSSLL